ncbi:hypothetical protein A2U01_0068772, partial [Trifolium medium]|nr:hypothetical protein [Trifolium medium]
MALPNSPSGDSWGFEHVQYILRSADIDMDTGYFDT